MRRVRAFILMGMIVCCLCQLAGAQELIDAWTIEFNDSDIDKYVPIVSTDLDNPGFFGIRDGRFEINDMEGPDCGSSNTGNNGNRGLLFSGIATSGYCDVSITFETSISDAVFEECLTPGVISPLGCTDFFGLTPGGDGLSFEVEYKSSRVMLGGYCGSTKEGRFTVSGLDIEIGDIYTVFIVGGTQSPDEAYYIDRIVARGLPKSIVPAEIVSNQESYCDSEGALFLNEISDGVDYVWTKDGDVLSSTSDTYVKAPVTLSDAGLYEVTFSDANGCANEASINVIVQDCQDPAPVFSLDSIFCQGDVMTLPMISDNGIRGSWNTSSTEIVLEESGASTFQFTTTNNTHSYNYQFDVYPTYRDTLVEELCTGQVYDADGTILSADGVTTSILLEYVTTNGCDSTVYIEVRPLSSTLFYLRDTLCEADVYPLTDRMLDSSDPIYHDTLLNAQGCDSIIDIELTFIPVQAISINHLICSTDKMEINGITYDINNPEGVDTLLSSFGCDSIVSIHLDFIIPDSITLDVPLCPGETKIVSGIEINSSISALRYYPTGVNGCDTMINFNIELLQPSRSVVAPMLCPDAYIMVNNKRYDIDNPNGREETIGANGCDSIINISLQFHKPDTTIINEVRCAGDGYELVVDGQAYNELNPAGQESLMSSIGCDSTVIINLSYLSQLSGEELYNGCRDDGYAVMVNGILYDQNNPRGTELIPTDSGCDSIVSIQLSYRIISSGLLSYRGCEGDGFDVEVNGQLYNEQNPVGVEVQSSNGTCDSTIEVRLVFLPTVYEDVNYQGCEGDGYTIEVNGMVYNENNPIGVETITGSTGCDSMVMIDLLYQLPDTTIINRDECIENGFNLMINGMVYDQNNPIGTELLMNEMGCDSVVMIDLRYSDEIVHNIAERLCSDRSIEVEGVVYDINNPSGRVSIMTSTGCDSIVIIDLSFYEDPNLSIEIDTIDSFGLYQLNLIGAIDTSTIRWNSDPALSCLSCDSPTASISTSVTLEVRAEDAYGCLYQESVSFNKENRAPNFYLPNIVNLNSNVGNHMIRPIVPRGIEANYDLTIYDRWGGIVYQIEGISTIHNNLGWSGLVNGERAMSGAYIYIAKVYFNGSRDPIVKTGAVTVY